MDDRGWAHAMIAVAKDRGWGGWWQADQGNSGLGSWPDEGGGDRLASTGAGKFSGDEFEEG